MPPSILARLLRPSLLTPLATKTPLVRASISPSFAAARRQQQPSIQQQQQRASKCTLIQVLRNGRSSQSARKLRSPALANRPEMKGVCVKVGTTKPKKPNSGVRKVARVRLSTGKVVTAYIPGEGAFSPSLCLCGFAGREGSGSIGFERRKRPHCIGRERL